MFKTFSSCCNDYPKPTIILLLSVLVVLLTAITWWKKKSRQERLLLPPGPWGLPLIGNLPFLDPQLHSYFAKLSAKYGPIIKVQLGIKSCVVFSSPEVAKQVLKDHGAKFADRDVPAAGDALSYGGIDTGLSPYSENSRMMRKLCVGRLLSPRNLETLYGLRHREVRDMVSKVYSLSKKGSSIGIGEHVTIVMFNTVTSMMWGNTLDGEARVRVAAKIREVVKKMMSLLAEPNVSDFFPMLAQFDLQGKARKMEELVKWFDQIFEFVIEERSKMRTNDGLYLLQELLQLIDQREQRSIPLTLVHIKALFLDMIIAATTTSAITMEWAMAELLNKPEILKKAQAELDEVVGPNNVVEETHLSQLPYLDAIVKEVLRLHPPSPLLLPRRARESCAIGGYLIPKGAKILVNIWLIQRDPAYWTDPMVFNPERFLYTSWDYNGNDFRYLPFGSGRRSCAGISLADKLLPYMLGSLLHSFNWELPEGTDLDLSENFEFDLKKKIPLVALATPRLCDTKLY